MKNPRGYYLMGLLMIAMFSFALRAQGSTSIEKTYAQTEFANPPPQQIVIAIVETPTYQITNEPAAYIQVDRGVSVPLKGLMITSTTLNNVKEKESYTNNRFCTDLGDRYTLQNNVTFIQLGYSSGNIPANCQRGVSRLDIGEI
jgi:hypothetical protein